MIKNWFGGHRFIRRIVRSAMDQYYRWKQLDPVFSEDKIVLHLFRSWYLNPKSNYSENQKNKIQRYTEADFYPHNLLEFCLISLDIEHNINPGSHHRFDSIANRVKEMMIDHDYSKVKSSKHTSVKPESISTASLGIKIIDFTGRWYRIFS